MKDIVKVRKFLKERLRRDATSFHGSEVEFKHIKENLFGLQASNSAILIGSRGSGKTTVRYNWLKFWIFNFYIISIII